MTGEAVPHTLVMGVLNVTPDSFSDGGSFLDEVTARARGRELAALGADIIDVGGESTRPGAQAVDPAEEQHRVLSVIESLAEAGLTVSVDTIHAETARAAVAAGATIINDVSGGLADPAMRAVAAETGATYVIGHWRGIPDPAHRRSAYSDVVAEVAADLEQLAADAIAAGVAPERIVLDPGLGFDKTSEQGFELLAGLGRLTRLGYPVLIGASRKRMLADLLETVPPAAAAATGEGPLARDLATSVVSAFAARGGAWGVRVHDVAGSVQALAVERAWRRAEPRVPTLRPEYSGVDRIALTGLEVFAHHGVFDFERAAGQRFLIDVEVAVDLAGAARSDALAQTVHYGELAEAVAAAVGRDPVALIETVAERVAGVALSFEGVRYTRVTVHKPDAPIELPFADVSVTIERHAARAAS